VTNMRLGLLSLFTIGVLLGSGSNKPGSTGAGGTVPPPPGTAELRVFSEIAPVGGTVQVKAMFTQPHPISSGGGRFALADMLIDGIAVSSPSGTSAGAALTHNGFLDVSLISQNSDLGTALDYPFLTITLDVPKSASAGARIPLDISGLTLLAPDGPITLTSTKLGTLSLTSSVSISGLYPGGGTWPSGTRVRVLGVGFQPNTKLTTKMKTSNPVLVSPTEMEFTLENTETLDQQPIQGINPDGSRVTYYSYIRGVLIHTPSQEILRRTEPIFPGAARITAAIDVPTRSGAAQFTAVALQNSNPGPVSVQFQLQSTGATATFMIPSGGRLVDDLAAILGTAVSPGDRVTVSSTAGIQILGIAADPDAQVLTPFLPTF
jgi:hypothetical protein